MVLASSLSSDPYSRSQNENTDAIANYQETLLINLLIEQIFLGPKLQKDLLDVAMCFRRYPVAVL